MIIAPGTRDGTTDLSGTRCYRLQSPRIPRGGGYRVLLRPGIIATIIRHERPSLIEIGSQFLVPWLVRAPARSLGVPVVCFYHSALPSLAAPEPESASPVRAVARRLVERYVRAIDQRIAMTIVASDFAKRDLERAGIRRIARIPLGVDLERFHPERRLRASEVRASFGIGNEPVALFVGRVASEKSLDVLIDAWPAIERSTGARLVLVGDGPLAERLRDRTRAFRVTWLGFERDTSRLADLYAMSDVFISPGSIETFGLASLEALASGTPVLSADRGGGAEQVVRSGGGATFVSGIADSLATSFAALLGMDRAALGAKGRAYAEREHAWPVVFGRMFQLYREVLRS